jgi:acyl-CoA dehydrogenase
MNLEFSDDQKFVQKTARDYLTENAPLSLCRAVLEGNKPYDPALWKGVAEMGWLGTAVPEAYGGAGLSHLELVLIAQEVGRALAPIPFSSSVYLATEAILQAGSEAQKQKYLPRLAAGETIGTLALAEGLGDFDASSATGTSFDGARVSGAKVPVSDGAAADFAVVLAKEGAGHSLVLVDLEGEGVTRTALASFDPSRPLAKLVFQGARGERLGAAGSGAQVARDVLDRAAVLMGYEQIGGAERALEMTRAFTMGRFAFGRPVASFQALKHRMADVYAKTQIALSNGYFAAWALSNGSEELPIAACSTRVAASDAFVLASEEMIQMHGGVGFTWEYDCHLFYRRARALAAALGTPDEWREKLVSRLQASGFVSGTGSRELAAD